MSFTDLFKKPSDNGTEAEMVKDPRWNGIPPVGKNPIDNKWKFLGLVTLVFIVKIIIWGFYRYLTGSMDFFTNPENGREMNYWVSMIAKPVLQLGPVLLIWLYIFKEKGSPFRFTKKNLFSSVVWGCIGGLIFFVVASFVYVGHMWIRGMGTDFSLVMGWDTVGWGLVIATLFSYMIGTGPAEEIFSRGFLQDQTSRAFSIGHAILFSAVLFAIGHLPISILVYDLPWKVIAWYMVVLVIMGGFFSIIYHWSRNIVLGIIIHGLWDWYLTLYQIKGAYTDSVIGASAETFGMLDTINTIITLALMLPIFYFIHKKFWCREAREKDREGRSAWERFARFVNIRDRGRKLKNPILFTVAVTSIFCIAMIPIGAIFATSDPERIKDRRIENLAIERFDYLNITDSGYLGEGENLIIELIPPTGNIIDISLKLTWTDEPDEGALIIDYSNQPDSMGASIMGPGGELLNDDEGSNGNIDLSWSYGNSDNNGTFQVIIDMLEAGDQTHPLRGAIQDNGNDYDIEICTRYSWIETMDEGDYHIRWTQ